MIKSQKAESCINFEGKKNQYKQKKVIKLFMVLKFDTIYRKSLGAVLLIFKNHVKGCKASNLIS